MFALTIGFAVLALVGHAAFWVGIVNRWHGTGFRRAIVKSVTLVFYVGLLAIPPAILFDWIHRGPAFFDASTWELNWATLYAALAAAYGAVHIPMWAAERIRSRKQPAAVRLSHDRVVDLAREIGFPPVHGWRAPLLSRVPGNQLWQLHVSEYSVHFPRLPAALEGLSVCHWSDLHLSGRIGREYYEEMVRVTNTTGADLIALTGDICDVARLIDWIPDIFGPAQARLGKYFILGNHDLRTKDVQRLRDAMREAEFIDVGGKRETIHEAPVEIAGNERPWFDNRPPSANWPNSSASETLKILLSHTPDELAWARAEGYDLMLAGHTHGGQIRFPVLGPVLCPSWHGTRYAAGFYHEPPTMLHVSRGTGSLFPVRINCRPEITKLVLTRRQ